MELPSEGWMEHSQRWLNAHHAEEVARDIGRPDVFGSSVEVQTVHQKQARRRHSGKNAIALLPDIFKVRNREAIARFRLLVVKFQDFMTRCGSWIGRGCSRTEFTMLKIAVLAPMPNPKVMIAVAAKPGFLRSWRIA